MAEPTAQDTAEPGFEETFQALEDAVARLEEGGLTLDESLALFTRAQDLAARCAQTLDAAELRVQQLMESE
jgi:exodeoxyribonuclease VII small subunit